MPVSAIPPHYHQPDAPTSSIFVTGPHGGSAKVARIRSRFFEKAVQLLLPSPAKFSKNRKKFGKTRPCCAIPETHGDRTPTHSRWRLALPA